MLDDTPEPLPRTREWLRAGLIALGVVALNAAYVASVLGLLHKPRRVLETDHYYYIAMAEHADQGAAAEQARTAPYCWRVLTPALAHQLTRLGLSVHEAFYLLTNLFLCGFLVALFGYLRVVGFGEHEALLGIVLVSMMQGAVRWYEYQYWMTDPLALFLVCLGLLLIELRKERGLLAVSLLGVLARESYLLVFAYYAVRALRRVGFGRALIRTLALAAAPVAVLLLLRAMITPIPGPRLTRVLQEILGVRAELLFTNQIYLATLGTFGVLLPLACARPRRLWAELTRHRHVAAFVATTYVTLLFGNNTDRLLAYAAPGVALFALLGLRALAGDNRRRWRAWAFSALALQLFFWRSTPFHGPALSVYQPTNWPVVALMLTFLGLTWWQMRPAARPTAAAR